MRKTKVGVLTFTDGREFLQKPLLDVNRRFMQALVKKLKSRGYEIVTGREVVWTNQLAAEEGKYLRAQGVDMTIFNYSVWAFPQFTAMAAKFAPGPLLLYSNINPQYPGLVGLMAASGALDQTGIPHRKLFGDLEDGTLVKQMTDFIDAAGAVSRIKGETYGLYGGRSIGIYTAVSNTDQWMTEFGIDVEQVDQLEVVRRAEAIDPERARSAREWCEKYVRKIHYNGKELTPEKLELQIKIYYAMKELNEEKGFDFCGIKSQTELTNNYCTTDVPEAFMNDPYDFDGPKEPVVCATEADMDAALTMEIFKYLARTPVLFADVRHYFSELGILDLVNSGQHATYFAGKSFDYKENLAKVEFRPEGFYFPGGGASVFHLAAPGEVTLARLMRKSGKYMMAIVPGELVQFDDETNEKLINEVQDNWPHAFFRLQVQPEEFFSTYSCNHIHGVYGDYVKRLIAVCELLDMPYRLYA